MMDKEKTFIGEDGLIYCSVCKEPKQAWLPERSQDTLPAVCL